jgi:hypothetical protein
MTRYKPSFGFLLRPISFNGRFKATMSRAKAIGSTFSLCTLRLTDCPRLTTHQPHPITNLSQRIVAAAVIPLARAQRCWQNEVPMDEAAALKSSSLPEFRGQNKHRNPSNTSDNAAEGKGEGTSS